MVIPPNPAGRRGPSPLGDSDPPRLGCLAVAADPARATTRLRTRGQARAVPERPHAARPPEAASRGATCPAPGCALKRASGCAEFHAAADVDPRLQGGMVGAGSRGSQRGAWTLSPCASRCPCCDSSAVSSCRPLLPPTRRRRSAHTAAFVPKDRTRVAADPGSGIRAYRLETADVAARTVALRAPPEDLSAGAVSWPGPKPGAWSPDRAPPRARPSSAGRSHRGG